MAVSYRTAQAGAKADRRRAEARGVAVTDLNRSWALRLAEAGIAVFPCGPDKRALVKWRTASTTDAAQLAQWWHQWPNALPAIDLDKSDLVVLDGDRHGGADGRTALRELLRGCNTNGAPIVLTPRDGAHVYFRQNGHALGNSSGDLPEGIDVRGSGGYVIAYAVMPDGSQYKAAASTPDLIAAFRAATIPHVPQPIVDLIQAPKRKHAEQPRSKPINATAIFGETRHQRYASAALDRLCDELAATPEGSRNTVLNNAALSMGHMIASGWIDQATVEQRLTAAAMAAGLIHSEIRGTLTSGINAGLKEPHPELINRPQQHQRTDAGSTSGNPDGSESTSSGEQPKSEPVKILSSAAFIASYVAPDYLIEGLLQRQFFYSLTGKTGGGKTAVALLFAAFVALGRTMDGKEFVRGRVLYLAGENPVDIQQRWIAMSQQTDFDGDTIDVHFIPGVFSVSAMADCIAEQVAALGGVSLVIIDTSAAYFEGDDENSNVQAGKYARMQRGLVNLPGGPTVLALCHPVKNAQDDNLLPRGGGAYLNECDGNLTAQKDGMVVEVHWQGKFRGPDFSPISFLLRTVTHERLKDGNGRLIPTVVVGHLTEAGQQELVAAVRTNGTLLLDALNEKEGASYAELAQKLGWAMRDGQPHKMMVKRTLEKLRHDKLVTFERDRWAVTEKGKRAIQQKPEPK
jgi:hypothetical protein